MRQSVFFCLFVLFGLFFQEFVFSVGTDSGIDDRQMNDLLVLCKKAVASKLPSNFVYDYINDVLRDVEQTGTLHVSSSPKKSKDLVLYFITGALAGASLVFVCFGAFYAYISRQELVEKTRVKF